MNPPCMKAIAFMLLVKSQHADLQISLGELMSYSLSPVPPNLGTDDGFFYKTNKAALLHAILDDVPQCQIELHIPMMHYSSKTFPFSTLW